MMLQFRSSLSGSAIAVTLIVIAATTTLALAVSGLVPRDYRHAQALENSLTAEYAAWAGIERALLELKRDPLFELSDQTVAGVRPFGDDIGEQCMLAAHTCLSGVDRFLGIPKNREGFQFADESSQLASGAVSYAVAVWHMNRHVGNFREGDANLKSDGLGVSPRASANINPIINRNQTRILDVSRLTNRDVGSHSVVLSWAPQFHTAADSGFSGECRQAEGRFVLSYAWGTSEGEILTDSPSEANNRGLLDFANIADRTVTLINPNPDIATRLHLTLFVTARADTDTAVADCFARYSIESLDAEGGADLGVSVIESTGRAYGVRKTVRVFVDRSNNTPLSVFEFGVVCQVCAAD